MNKYKVTVPLDGFQVIVTTKAYDAVDARRAAIDMVTYQFPIVINHSEEFEFGGGLIGHPKSVKKIDEDTTVNFPAEILKARNLQGASEGENQDG